MTSLRISWTILLAGVGACATEARQSDAISDDGPTVVARTAVPLGATQNRPTASADILPVASLDPAVRGACDSAASRWNAIAGATVTRSDTILGPDDVIQDAIGDNTAPPPDPRRRNAACVVVGLHPKGLDRASFARLYWPARGWGNIWRLAADGPDGQVQTYQRGYVRCQVEDRSDGGDDSDSTYVPDPFFRQETRCWQHSRLIVPADTLKELAG